MRSPKDYVRAQFSGFRLRYFLNFSTKMLNLKPENSASTMGFSELTCGGPPSTLQNFQELSKSNSSGTCRLWPPLHGLLAQNAEFSIYLQHVGHVCCSCFWYVELRGRGLEGGRKFESWPASLSRIFVHPDFSRLGAPLGRVVGEECPAAR